MKTALVTGAALLLRDYGGLDALVNNSGVSLIAPAEHTTAAQCLQRVEARADRSHADACGRVGRSRADASWESLRNSTRDPGGG